MRITWHVSPQADKRFGAYVVTPLERSGDRKPPQGFINGTSQGGPRLWGQATRDTRAEAVEAAFELMGRFFSWLHTDGKYDVETGNAIDKQFVDVKVNELVDRGPIWQEV